MFFGKGPPKIDTLAFLLEQINPDLFLTRHRDQFALAQARGFECVVVK